MSDIHASHAAAVAAVDAAERERADEIWSLGDIVDWGPEPSQCMDLMDDVAVFQLAGNHDLLAAGCLSPSDRATFSTQSLRCSQFTRAQLRPEQLAALAARSPLGRRHGAVCAHGSPRNPIWEYISEIENAERALADTAPNRVVFVGHTHQRAIWTCARGGTGIERVPALSGVTVDLGDSRWVFNPGSVGCPRFSEHRSAEWLLWDTDANTVTMHAAPVDPDAKRAAVAALSVPDDVAHLLNI